MTARCRHCDVALIGSRCPQCGDRKIPPQAFAEARQALAEARAKLAVEQTIRTQPPDSPVPLAPPPSKRNETMYPTHPEAG